MECFFCCNSERVIERRKDSSPFEADKNIYDCPRCGPISIPYVLSSILAGDKFNDRQKRIISICLRTSYEKDKNKSPIQLSMQDLEQFLNSYREMDAIEKMDHTLLILDKKSEYYGASLKVDIQNDYPLYHCFEQRELHSQLKLLKESGFIYSLDPSNPHNSSRITVKGYERLRELRKVNKDSRQCFVAMWFADEMEEVFKKAIKPAIEYSETGRAEPKFKALRISDKEHTNDINDEIIAEIRRSRFMVCDLTGYRGGVYWEAGFAYGLGLEVIYTCREDWLKTIESELFDKDGNMFKVKQEGIHFDLEHRSRIQWRMDNLPVFKKKLLDRIKAVIT